MADLLEPACSVTIAAFGSTIWPPVAHDSRIRLIPSPRSNLGVPQARGRLADLTKNASAIVAVKARALSYGMAVAVRGERPLLLDLDDFEPAFVRRRLGWLRQLMTPDHLPITEVLMRWRPRRVTVTVASRELQRRFGGMWLPHVRDRDGLAAEVRTQRDATRRRHSIDDGQIVVGFVGTARAHKGLTTLAAAICHVPETLLAIIGDPGSEEDIAALSRLSGGRILILPGPRIDQLGASMSIADILAVPQSRTLVARYQSPAKLLDAMAAGIPVIAGDVGDARELVGDSGILVWPDDPEAFVGGLSLLSEARRRTELGAATRRRYEQRFRLSQWREVVRQQILPGLGLNLPI
jgi:glycosyltransferase involved in cell wall biosynthesis